MRRTAVILDAHPLWLDAVEGVLERLDLDVVGKTSSFAEGRDLVSDTRPDVLLLEPFDNAGKNPGLQLMKHAQEIHPALKTIVLSDSHETDSVDAAFEAGACAYVFKSSHPEDLASVIRQVFDVSIFLAQSHRPAPAKLNAAATPQADSNRGLTKRELEILQLVAEGHSNGELARTLWVTEQTVKFHLSNIYRKLNVANRTEASRWAQLNGLLTTPATASVA
jgi:DNA-binding NarL/FixJ family response regulator